MDQVRECFMMEAGDLEYELKEVQKNEKNDVSAPATTENTPFFTIFCC